MRTNSTIKIKCKCGCEKPPTLGYRGYNVNCVPEDLKQELTRNKVAKRNKANAATTVRKLYKAQQKRGVTTKYLVRKPTKPIAKNSKKRIAELKIYSVLRKDYLKDHPRCEAKLSGCQGKAKDIHHKAARGRNLNNVDTWLAVCRNCHTEIHFNSKQAHELGLLLRG